MKVIFLAAVLAACALRVDAQDPVKVSIYYSVLCNTCQGFITSKFKPVYDDLSDYINVDLIPYGNSTYSSIEGDLEYEFSCEHGADECGYNRWHACAVDRYQSAMQQQPRLVEYVFCTMYNNQFDTDNQKCAEDNDLDFADMGGCANGGEGNLLLKALGDRTHGHIPKIGYFPTIEFNGEYHQIDQEMAIDDFREAVCQYLEVDGEMPAACSAPGPVAASLLALLAALTIALRASS